MRGLYVVCSCMILVVLAAQSVVAQRYTSPNYTIDASVGNSFGGNVESTNYKLTASGGESIIGSGSGGSYLLGQGYVSQLEQGLSLTLSSAEVSFPSEIISGSSQVATTSIGVISDAPGYTISVSQNNNLRSGANTIPPVSGPISSPTLWQEGATRGFGVTTVSATGTAPSPVWSGGAAYGAIPNSPTTLYTRLGSTNGSSDTIVVRYRIDVPASQVAGNYSNQVTYTGTITP